MKYRAGRLALIAMVAIFVRATASASVTIDSFEDRPDGFPMVAGNLSWISLVSAYPHVIGGRGIGLAGTTVLASLPWDGASSAKVGVDINNSNGAWQLEYESIDSGAGGELTILYGAMGGSGDLTLAGDATPLGLDSNPSTDVLRLSFLDYNHAHDRDMSLNVVLSTETATSTISAILTSSGAQTLDVPLTSLQGPTLDFIELDFNAPADTNFTLDSVALITAVPEPGSLIFLAIAGAGLLRRREALPRYSRLRLVGLDLQQFQRRHRYHAKNPACAADGDYGFGV